MPDLGAINCVHTPKMQYVVQIPQDDAFFTTPVLSGSPRSVKRAPLLSPPAQIPDLGEFLVNSGPSRMDRYPGPNVLRFISGNVQVQGIYTEGVTVRVFRRDNGVCIGVTTSGALGAYSIPIIGYDGLCTVVAYDIDGEPLLNAAIADNVTPEL